MDEILTLITSAGAVAFITAIARALVYFFSSRRATTLVIRHDGQEVALDAERPVDAEAIMELLLASHRLETQVEEAVEAVTSSDNSVEPTPRSVE